MAYSRPSIPIITCFLQVLLFNSHEDRHHELERVSDEPTEQGQVAERKVEGYRHCANNSLSGSLNLRKILTALLSSAYIARHAGAIKNIALRAQALRLLQPLMKVRQTARNLSQNLTNTTHQ